MTTTLQIRLPWGFYHATPWDSSPNEGEVEWPPSPWRMLRALYYSWKVHFPEHSHAEVHSLLEVLAHPPKFALPTFERSHVRHYFPGVAFQKGVDGDRAGGSGKDTSKTLDAFVVTERNATILVRWPGDLAEDQRSLLSELATGIRYLGRAETVVDIELISEDKEVECNSAPLDGEDVPQTKTVSLLAPLGALDFGALVMSPREVRAKRWLLPPATCRIAYSTPSPQDLAPTRRNRVARPTVTAVRLAIEGPTCPSVFEGVAVGHLAHLAFIKRHGTPSRVLSGCDEMGKPLGGLHGHVHYLPLATDGRRAIDGRRVDTLVAWAPDGFSESELLALESPSHLNPPPYLAGIGRRKLSLITSGCIANVAPELAEQARVWTSVTPYSPVAHFRGSLERQLQLDVVRELRNRWPDGAAPEIADLQLMDGPWLRYRRYRPMKEGIWKSRPAYGLRLTFAEPVAGPLALGALSHFGLGLFAPEG